VSEPFDDATLDAYAYEHANDPLGEGWADEPADEHVPTLAMTLEDWRDDESVEERNARIRERDDATRQADRAGGTRSDPWPIAHEWAKERDRELERLPRHGELGADAAAVRRFIRAELEAAGLDAESHLHPPPRGKPTAAARAVREALAPVVAAARAKGAKLEALAAATNRTVSTVEALLRDAPNPEIAAPLGEGV
jgi:hypothetical protein